MSKGVRLSAGLLIITAAVIAGFSLQMPKGRPSAEHDDRVVSDEFSHKLLQRKALRDRREAWWQWIHNAAPGDDWKAIERENRHQHQLKRNAMRKQAGQSGLKTLTSSDETFPQLGLSGRWSEIGSTTQAGRILATEYNPDSSDILAIADGGQLWRRDGSTGEWRSLNDALKMERGIGVHSTEIDGATRIALINRFAPMIFLYSDDDGQTWTESAVPPLANFEDTFLTDSWQLNDSGEIITCGRKSFAGQNQFPCFHSTDGGGSFREFASYSGTTFSTMDHWVDTDSGRIFGLTVRGGVPRLVEYRTSGTVSDTEMNGVILGTSDSGFQLTGSGDTLYAAMPYDVDDNGEPVSGFRIFRSVNGSTWQQRGDVPTLVFSQAKSFAASKVNPDVLAIGQIDAFRSVDGGLNWDRINFWYEYYSEPSVFLHADIPNFEFTQTASGEDVVFVSTDGGTYRSDDDLNTVTNLSLNGLNNSQYYDILTAPGNSHRLYAGSQDQGWQQMTAFDNQGADFLQRISGDYAYLASAVDGQDLWTVYPDTVYYLSDVGIGPGGIRSGFFSSYDYRFSNDSLFFSPLMVEPDDPHTAWLALKTDDEGLTLNRLLFDEATFSISRERVATINATPEASQISAMAISPLESRFRYLTVGEFFNPSQFHFSSDSGVTWQLQQGSIDLSDGFLTGQSIVPDPVQVGRVYLAGSGYSNPGVYVSDDHGASFSPLADGLPSTLVYQLALTADGSMLFAATEAGPYAMRIADGQWIDISGLTAPEQAYTAVEYLEDINVVRFATYGRGIWDLELYPTGDTFRITPGHSGVFFDPTHDGEGIMLEILGENLANLVWFTFDGQRQQAWLVATGEFDGRNLVFRNPLLTDGARFGDGFDPADVSLIPWGKVTVTIRNCNRLDFSYDGLPEFGPGTQDMVRLASIHGLPCGADAQPDAATAWSGSFYDSDRSGEGIFIQTLDVGRVLVSWYTYGPDGGQAWLIGEGVISGDRVTVENLQRVTNGYFGPEFNPVDIQRQSWGQMVIDRSDCNTLSISYQGPPAFGDGVLDYQRLTAPMGLVCP